MPGAEQNRPSHSLAPDIRAFPVRDDEAARYFASLSGLGRLGLAVSGGADSMALMHLAADWARAAAGRPTLHVLSVDHGLRETSRAEANTVIKAARRLGMAAEVLTWEGEKPASGLPAAAREARYSLFAQAAERLGLDAIATAHTEDDQAETLLMRLARGSGVDGLSGIPARTRICGVTVVRPLLAMTHARALATLRARSIAWFEDPTNSDERFERARLRATLPDFANLGLTTKALATSARRLARARAAIDLAVDAALVESAGVVRLDKHGFAEIDWAKFVTLAEDVRLKVLARLIDVVAAPPEPLSLSRLEALTEGLSWQAPIGRTLGGAMFLAGRTAKTGRLLIVRELARRAPQPRRLLPGESVLWDRRFRLTSTAGSRPVDVAALGADGLAAIEKAGYRRPKWPAHAVEGSRIPARVLQALPACRDDKGQVVAVPVLGLAKPGAEGISCRFATTVAT